MKRSERKEFLDSDDIKTSDLFRSIRFMALVNRYFGGTGNIIRFLERADVPETFSLLDVGCGGGDITLSVARWAEETGRKADITAIDINEDCLSYAKQHCAEPSVKFINHSAFDLDTLGKFDYIISSMFFHHLKDDEIQNLLRLFSGYSEKGFIVNDLCRSPLAVLSAFLLSLISLSPIVIHDATLSVMRGFDVDDARKLTEKSGNHNLKFSTRPVFRAVFECYAG